MDHRTTNEFQDSKGNIIVLHELEVKLPSVLELLKKYNRFITKKKELSEDEDEPVIQRLVNEDAKLKDKCVVNVKPVLIQYDNGEASHSESDYTPTEDDEDDPSSPEKSPIQRRLRSNSRNKKERNRKTNRLSLRSRDLNKIEDENNLVEDTESSLTSGSETEEVEEPEDKSSPKSYNLRKRPIESNSDSDVPGLQNNRKIRTRKRQKRLPQSSSESEDDKSNKIETQKLKEQKTEKPLPKANLKKTKEHNCPTCKKHFSHLFQVKKHMKSHGEIKNLKRGQISLKIPNIFKKWKGSKVRSCLHNRIKHICLVCSIQRRQFKRIPPSRKLKKPKPQKRHTCKFCLNTYNLHSYLKVHEEFHSKKNPYHCNVCLEGFSSEEKFLQHRKSHPKICLNFKRCGFCQKKLPGRRLQAFQHLWGKHRAEINERSENAVDEISESAPNENPLNFGEVILKGEEEDSQPQECASDSPPVSTTNFSPETNTPTTNLSQDDGNADEECLLVRIVPIENLMDKPIRSPSPKSELIQPPTPNALPENETLTLHFSNGEPPPENTPLVEANECLDNSEKLVTACPYCKHRNDSITGLQLHCLENHVVSNKPGRPFLCPHMLCNQSYSEISNLRTHQIIFHDMVHVSSGYEYCLKFYDDMVKAYSRRYSTADVQNLQIQLKELLTQDFYQRVQKLKDWSLQKSIVCPFCSEIFPTYNELSSHASSFHADLERLKYKCQHLHCTRRFQGLAGLVDHELLVHQVNLVTSKNTLNETSEITSSSSPTHEPGPSMASSFRNVEPNKTLSPGLIDSTTSPTPNEKCPYCNSVFSKLQDLQLHGFTHQTPVLIDQVLGLKYVCPIQNCSLIFDDILNVRNHQRSHKSSPLRRNSNPGSSTGNNTRDPEFIDLTVTSDRVCSPRTVPNNTSQLQNALNTLDTLVEINVQELFGPNPQNPRANGSHPQNPSPNDFHPQNQLAHRQQIIPNAINQHQNSPISQNSVRSNQSHQNARTTPQSFMSMPNNQPVERFQNNVSPPARFVVPSNQSNYTPQQIRPVSTIQTPQMPALVQQNPSPAWGCNKCFEKFHTLDQLTDHFRIHYEFQCLFCQTRFMTEIDTIYHMKQPHPYNCTELNCARSFESPIHLKTHLHNAHYITQQNSRNQLMRYTPAQVSTPTPPPPAYPQNANNGYHVNTQSHNNVSHAVSVNTQNHNNGSQFHSINSSQSQNVTNVNYYSRNINNPSNFPTHQVNTMPNIQQPDGLIAPQGQSLTR